MTWFRDEDDEARFEEVRAATRMVVPRASEVVIYEAYRRMRDKIVGRRADGVDSWGWTGRHAA